MPMPKPMPKPKPKPNPNPRPNPKPNPKPNTNPNPNPNSHQVNYLGVVRVSKAFVPQLRRSAQLVAQVKPLPKP